MHRHSGLLRRNLPEEKVLQETEWQWPDLGAADVHGGMRSLHCDGVQFCGRETSESFELCTAGLGVSISVAGALLVLACSRGFKQLSLAVLLGLGLP